MINLTLDFLVRFHSRPSRVPVHEGDRLTGFRPAWPTKPILYDTLNVGNRGNDLTRSGALDEQIENAKSPGGKHPRKRGKKISTCCKSLSSLQGRILVRCLPWLIPSRACSSKDIRRYPVTFAVAPFVFRSMSQNPPLWSCSPVPICTGQGILSLSGRPSRSDSSAGPASRPYPYGL